MPPTVHRAGLGAAAAVRSSFGPTCRATQPLLVRCIVDIGVEAGISLLQPVPPQKRERESGLIAEQRRKYEKAGLLEPVADGSDGGGASSDGGDGDGRKRARVEQTFEDDFSKSTFGAELVTVTTKVGLPDSDDEGVGSDGGSSGSDASDDDDDARAAAAAAKARKHVRIVPMEGMSVEETARLVREANEREAERERRENTLARLKRAREAARKQKLQKRRSRKGPSGKGSSRGKARPGKKGGKGGKGGKGKGKG